MAIERYEQEIKSSNQECGAAGQAKKERSQIEAVARARNAGVAQQRH